MKQMIAAEIMKARNLLYPKTPTSSSAAAETPLACSAELGAAKFPTMPPAKNPAAIIGSVKGKFPANDGSTPTN